MDYQVSGVLKATVSGSFRRHMAPVQEAVYELTDLGVLVLSPADPRVVDAFGEFLFVASDRLRTVRVVQSRHFEAIRESDFLWIATPDGYVGQSTALEIGFAVALGRPILASAPPSDLTLRQFVRVVPSLSVGVAQVLLDHSPEVTDLGVLIDPVSATNHGHDLLQVVRERLIRPSVGYQDNDYELSAAADSIRGILRGV